MDFGNHSVVTWAALVMGGLCFLLYVISAGAAIFARPKADALVAEARDAAALQPKGIGAADLTKLIEAAGKLTDSLSKASPTLVSLIGAILFMAIAAVSDGALRAPPAAPSGAAPAAQGTR
jgi:hypothetical protein